MTDSQFSAQCDSCALEYRVPDSTMTYACRECDGQVRVVVLEEDAEASSCPQCEELVSKADAYCGGCGEDLKAAEVPDGVASRRVPVVKGRRRPGGSARRSGRAGEERRQASHELVKAFGFLKTLRIKTGALWPCVLAHFVWNGLAVYLVD